MSVGFMVAFPIVGALVLSAGWRYAWGAVGLALVVVVAPLAWFLDRSSPESVGLSVDGDETPPRPAAADATLGDALRSPAFWVFALATSLYGLVASGIGLFNESILAERGFAPGVYHQALAVTAISGLAGNFAAGALADRGSIRTVAVTALLILSGALVGLAQVATTEQVMIQAVAMGIAGGFVMVVFFSFWGRAYGRLHLGRIQGAAQAMTVIASAVGPLLLAASIGSTGSYASAFYILAACVALLALAALVVRIPSGAATMGTP
jgi:MFS family permease